MDVNRSREKLIELLAAPQVDRAAIAAKQGEIHAGQRKMQSLVIEHLLDQKKALNAKHQEALFRMLRRRSRSTGHDPAMGMGLRTGPPIQERCRGRERKEIKP